MLLEAIAILPEQHVLKGMFRKVQLRPSEQTFHTFQIPSRVYLRFSSLKTTSKLAYVGSTTQTVAAREATRFRKFQQLKNERMVSVELSLRYWRRQGIGQRSPSHPQFQTSSCWAGNMPRYRIFSPLSIFRSYNNGFAHVGAFSRPATPGNCILWDLAESLANSGRPRPNPGGFLFLPEFRRFSLVFVTEKKCGNCFVIWAATRQSGSKPRRRFEPMCTILPLYVVLERRACVCRFIYRCPRARLLNRL